MNSNNNLIICKEKSYSLDCRLTHVNNNVLVVGTSGAGKTRSIVTPNLLCAAGSYIVSDPKGSLYKKYGHYLRNKGYIVKNLDFTDPKNSTKYNFFRYIHGSEDIVKISRVFVGDECGRSDPFWNQSAIMLLNAAIGYLYEFTHDYDRNIQNILKVLKLARREESYSESTYSSRFSCMIAKAKEQKPDSWAVAQFEAVNTAPDRTFNSILITVLSKIAGFASEGIENMTMSDYMNITQIGRKKTVVFVTVSDTDRSMDDLANIFYTQAMQTLCDYADKKCENQSLPVPIRFIMDDFATNCKIEEFPRIISTIRSRNISAMLMIQAESQLAASFGNDASTIIGNCDTYVYMGGNDRATADEVARRANLPLSKILYMPVGTNWVFRRGEMPFNGNNVDLDEFIKDNCPDLQYESRKTNEYAGKQDLII